MAETLGGARLLGYDGEEFPEDGVPKDDARIADSRVGGAGAVWRPGSPQRGRGGGGVPVGREAEVARDLDVQGQIAVLTRSVGDLQRLVEGALPDRCPSRSRTHSAREFALASCILFTWYADDDAALTMGTKGGITATSASRTWAARPAAPVPLESAAAAASWWTPVCPLAWDAACGATDPSAVGTA